MDEARTALERNLAREGDQQAASIGSFMTLVSSHDRASLFEAVTTVEQEWHPGSAVMILECIPLIRSNAVREAAIDLLQRQTGQQFDCDSNAWYR